MKSSDNGRVDFSVSTGLYPEHAKRQEEGQPRAKDYLKEEAHILGRQLVASYGPMEPRDKVLPVTICGIQDKLSHIPILWGGEHYKGTTQEVRATWEGLDPQVDRAHYSM